MIRILPQILSKGGKIMNERKDNLEKLENSLEVMKQQGHSSEVTNLVEKAQLQQPAPCSPVIFDCCTITLAPESILEFPFGLINIGADFFFLDCCITEVSSDALTPCGIIPDACTVNEVRATGHINYVASFTIPTFYNNGAGDCNEVVEQTFSCSGTTCVNNVICYAPVTEDNPCPDFCNGNTQAFAYIQDIDYCSGQKAIVTVGIVFVLPECI